MKCCNFHLPFHLPLNSSQDYLYQIIIIPHTILSIFWWWCDAWSLTSFFTFALPLLLQNILQLHFTFHRYLYVYQFSLPHGYGHMVDCGAFLNLPCLPWEFVEHVLYFYYIKIELNLLPNENTSLGKISFCLQR